MKQPEKKFRPQNGQQASGGMRERTAFRDWRRWVLVLLLCVLVFGGLLVGVVGRDNKPAASKQVDLVQKQPTPTPFSLSLVDMLDLPSSELEHTEVALMNLLCAQRLAATRKIRVKLFSREKVMQVFFAEGEGTKHALAEILAKRFPDELREKLPPKRRPWMSEDSRMDTTADNRSPSSRHASDS